MAATSLVDITATTKAFFVQETVDNQWEVYFGDGVIGDAVDEGNVVILSYVITIAAAANGAVAFTAGVAISGFNDITVRQLPRYEAHWLLI